MKIAMVSKADRFGGGASQVAVDLTAALQDLGASVRHYVGWSGKERLRDTYPAHVIPLFGGAPLRLATKSALVGGWLLGVPEAVPFEWPAVAASGLLDADLLHVHDITELFSPLTMAWLSRRKPVVWTLHDMSGFTAGCIASFDGEPLGCERWSVAGQGCDGGCPLRAMRRYPFGGVLNGVPLLWRAKRALARRGRMHLVAPSTWLAGEVERSLLYRGRRPPVIHNGIDTAGVFVARPKPACRAALGLSAGRVVIALMAGDLADPLKGFAQAVATLRALPEALRARLQLVCIGKRDHAAETALAGFAVHWAGFVHDQTLLAIMLAAADLLLYPSMADNQPLAVIEALACGTPVFAYATGGIAEIIGADAGVVVTRKDSDGLAAALAASVDGGRLETLAEPARARAVAGFSRARMARDYLEFYQKVMNGTADGTADAPATLRAAGRTDGQAA